jgi:hypothetical protein
MSAERVVANTLRLAQADLDAAKLLHAGKKPSSACRPGRATTSRCARNIEAGAAQSQGDCRI